MTRLTVVCLLLLTTASTHALCNGDACEYLRIKERNNCIVLENTHSGQALSVNPLEEAARGYVWTVNANSETTAEIEGGLCLQNWYQLGHEATFVHPVPE